MKYSIHLNCPFGNSFIQYLFSTCDVSETVLGMRNVEVQNTGTRHMFSALRQLVYEEEQILHN